MFAVKKSLVVDFAPVDDTELARKWGVQAPFRHADFEEVTDPARAEEWNVGKVPFRHADFEIIMQPGS